MKYSKRKAIRILFLVLLAAICIFLLRFCTAADVSSDQANDRRIDYLAALGWEVEREPVELLSLTLPRELQEPYLSYNALQLRQGFDLSRYCGKTLERCTYTVTNHPTGAPCQADLYLFDGEVVAGDILCTGEGGFIAPLEFPAKQ